jgi:2-dehydro-3-deoxygluconokinase
MTKLPPNDVADAAINYMRYFGVDTSKIIYGLGRMGLYYLEKGASQRPYKVIYDRAFSAISMSDRNDFDWESIFEVVEWFHWTGINPALSDNMAEICLDACKVAKKWELQFLVI